ncbi:MAG TPA: alpha/beta fold hydrolase [Ktedonobacteraceae bacterium]|nr:alpha/beta fold hydrolase [Ktedonobacteraceae bacterium]
MPFDIELYRRTILAPVGRDKQKLRRISVIDMRPEDARLTLVMVHGYGGSATQWLYQLQFFGQTMRVVAPDLRGHGLSDDPAELPCTMDELVNDLEITLDRLDVARPFYLLAHSFGGAIATEYILRHPGDVRGLILVSVPSRFILREIVRRLLIVPDPIFSWVARTIKVALYAPQRTLKRMHDYALSQWRGHERMEQLRVPSLAILGHRDNVFMREYYEDVSRSIPGAQQVVIPVSAHLVQLERPDAVNRAMRRFIDARQKNTSTLPQPAQPPAASAQTVPQATRLAEMPWLQYYDNGVPETLPLPKQLLHDILNNSALNFPDRPALIFFGQKISYRELDRASNRCAHALRKIGVQKGERVAIILPNVPQYVIGVYGTLKAGGVVVLGSPLSNEEEITYQLKHSGVQVLLTLSAYRPLVERICAGTSIQQIIFTDVREYLPLRQRVRLANLIDSEASPARAPTLPDEDGLNENVGAQMVPAQETAAPDTPRKRNWREYEFQQLLHSQPATLIDSGASSDDLALLLYTSGTTDTPKGVMLSHRNLVVNVLQQRHCITDARRGKEVILGVLPLSHSYGVTSCMNLSIAIAGTLVLLPAPRIEQIMEAIKQHHPSIFPGVPALYLAIANYPRVRSYGVAAIRTCVSGSAPLPVEVQETFEKLTRGRLVEGYGLTEASPSTHTNPLKGERRVGSIGLPIPGTLARIVDVKTGEPLPPDEVGELLIRGPQVMMGYWKMPEETRAALQNGWLRTGDLARMDEDGFFTIVDRKKDLILSGSYNVYPRDVEEVLYEHPKVLEVAVVSMKKALNTQDTNSSSDEKAAPFIKAVVVLKRGEKATAEELLALCRERLDAYKVPRQIEFRSELPKNFVGKVLRRLLVES